MLGYSLLLTLALGLSAPWWLLRMATTERYREGLPERFGAVPARLREAVRSKRVVWLHAVSVGEVLASTRLVAELEAALGAGWVVVVSTTTKTGQEIARKHFGTERVFYMPLDFGWAVKAYLRALRPAAVVLMESEIWPRMLHECSRGGVPVAVVNARVSDRSFARAMRVRAVWSRVLRMPSLWLAQSEEDGRRLVAMGARAETVCVTGNLKYDVRDVAESPITRRIRELRGASRVIVAGSTLEGEEEMLLAAWPRVLRGGPDMVLVIAPRHPERFADVFDLIQKSGNEALLCSDLSNFQGPLKGGMILLLDTIGDLASVYSVASAAFIGGSLVAKGGHNPLEATRYGVPVLMGESYENFREIVEGLKAAGGIEIIKSGELEWRMINAPRYSQRSGKAGQDYSFSKMGATKRITEAIVTMTHGGSR
jgi:3-deoxy-D-manno-octulosonic-acid transferase